MVVNALIMQNLGELASLITQPLDTKAMFSLIPEFFLFAPRLSAYHALEGEMPSSILLTNEIVSKI